ncbi:MAG: HTH domain-containing protein [Christensenellaceae bacterium]|jgi:predicted DNA-binding protein YlxM (UPF0122 family)|nr:HTH domain-containing protein [Christensenellaceae bacterium]
MERSARLNCLMDFYGPLLTERQRRLLQLRVEEDLSLSEIAENLSISRQAVSEALQKAEAQLNRYEERLGLYSRVLRTEGAVRAAIALIEQDQKNEALLALRELMMEDENGL